MERARRSLGSRRTVGGSLGVRHLWPLVTCLVVALLGCGGGDGAGNGGGAAVASDTLQILTLTQTEPSEPAADGELDVDPLGRGDRIGTQTPVIFIHGFDFPLGGRSPKQQMDDIIADVPQRLPDWDDRYQAWLYLYDPLKDLADSASELAGELRRLQYHGAVILVGYSQGGLVARSFDTRFGDEFPVSLLIMIATPNGGLPLAAMKAMLLDDIDDLPDPLPTTLLREVARTIYREVFDNREVSDDLREGSAFLASLAAPKDNYYAIAGVGSDANLFLDYVSNLDVYAGLPNDGLVSVESVEVGLIAGRTAELGPGLGYPDKSHLSIIRADSVFASVAELLQAGP
jgi:pimeloyl-ACP methyl ester carboxylesterase